uniref:Reverse transcriptase domain-containing protein n=1 Tax=Bursaphelenchus xylophilus TaxID=6326 RepID=A0A1I7SN72_BURXY
VGEVPKRGGRLPGLPCVDTTATLRKERSQETTSKEISGSKALLIEVHGVPESHTKFPNIPAELSKGIKQHQ